MSPEQQMVADFHRKFNLPMPDKPMDDHRYYRRALRGALIAEELEEFNEAALMHDIPEMVDGLCDLLYVVYGAAVELGVDLEPFFVEVHRTNMLKEGGSTRADGKLIKPPGWQRPRIKEMLEEIA